MLEHRVNVCMTMSMCAGRLQITVTLFEDEGCNTDGLDGYEVAVTAEEGDDGHRRLEAASSWWASWW
jgi:hypothetical protein